MEKYLLQILLEKSRVIIPEFGAIIVKQKNPRKLIFNEFLQYNDGALINAIAKEEGIDRDMAEKKVTVYVSEIRKRLAAGKTIKLTEIGNLSQNSSGKISLQEISEAPDAENKTELSKEDEKPSEVDESTLQKKSEEENTVEFQDDDSPKEKKEPVKETSAKEPEKPKTVEAPKIKAQEKPEPTKSPIPKVEKKVEPPIETYFADSGNRQTRNIIWIIAIVLFNAGLIITVLYFDSIKAFFNKDKSAPQIERTEIPVEEPLEEQISVIDSSTNIEGQTENEVLSDEDDNKQVEQEFYSTKYYVVAGVFSIEQNADNLVNELKNRGFKAVKFGKIGDLHAVCYDVFPSMAEANVYLNEIKQTEDPEAWIRKVE